MLTVPPSVKLWYCPDAVDMRLGFDGLFALAARDANAADVALQLLLSRGRAGLCFRRLAVAGWLGQGQDNERFRGHAPDIYSPSVSNEPHPAAAQLAWKFSGRRPGTTPADACRGGAVVVR
jgi:hypothetical protein